MPKVGGRETFRAMRDIDPDVKVVLSSGYSLEGQAQEMLDKGALGFIHKPFRQAELSRVVAEALIADER